MLKGDKHRPIIAQDEAIQEFVRERRFQDRKHGSIYDKPHTIGDWLIIIELELQEAKLALAKGGSGRDHVLMEIVQIGASAMAAIEEHGTEPFEGRGL